MGFLREKFIMISIILLPGDDLDERTGLRNACFGVEHTGISSMIEI